MDNDSDDKIFYAKHGVPTEPGLCAECGTRPGTERLQNVTLALGEEPSDPTPDQWICRPCLEDQITQSWTERVQNVEHLFANHPGDRDALERAAAQVAAHLRAEIDRYRLPAPEAVCNFLVRHGA